MNIRKHEVLRRVSDLGVVGIIAASDVEAGVATAEAIFEGGIDVLEISTALPGAFTLLKEIVARDRCRGAILGAGAVDNAVSARLCVDAGAEFLSSYCFDMEVAKMCNRSGIAYMPGVGTASEAALAMELGVDVVRAFPGEALGPKFIKSVRSALPAAHVMPAGGVVPGNLDDWFQAGAFAVGLGSALVRPAGAEGDYGAVSETAERIVIQIALIRSNK